MARVKKVKLAGMSVSQLREHRKVIYRRFFGRGGDALEASLDREFGQNLPAGFVSRSVIRWSGRY